MPDTPLDTSLDTPLDPMLPWLAAELLRIRGQQRLSCVRMSERLNDFLEAQDARKRDGSPYRTNGPMVNRVEHGQWWPQHPDLYVAAFADVAGMPAVELWQRAIAAWTTARIRPDATAAGGRVVRRAVDPDSP